MKRTRQTPEQIVNKLHESDAMLAAGREIAQVVQALGVSEQTLHRWQRYCGQARFGPYRNIKQIIRSGDRLGARVLNRAGLDLAGKPWYTIHSSVNRPRHLAALWAKTR